ncbi:MAG: two-component system response regulator [Bacteroidia bacterium]
MAETLSVMLIDDNEFDLFLNERFIQTKNLAHKIVKFDYADDAFQYLDTAALNDLPDIILLDIHMPIMDGFEFLEKYGTLPPEKLNKTRIIMVSSSLDQNDNIRAKENPSVLALLTKPLNMDDMMRLLRENGVLNE